MAMKHIVNTRRSLFWILRWLLWLLIIVCLAILTCLWFMHDLWLTVNPTDKVGGLALSEATTPLHAANLTMESKDRRGDGVLYVVRSGHKNYRFQVSSILRTWGQDIRASPSDGLIVVGDVAVQNPAVLGVLECGKDHSLGLCCKTGYALQFAHHWVDDFAWFFVVDDDTFVNIRNLRQVLSTFSFLEAQALGVLGCGPGFCEDGLGGFCGGGGYALSRAALKRIMANSTSSFQVDLMSHLATERDGMAYDDISVACLLKRHRVRLQPLHGLYAFGSPKQWLDDAYERAITSQSPLPITFHYVGPILMEALHNRFERLSAEGDVAAPESEKRVESSNQSSPPAEAAKFSDFTATFAAHTVQCKGSVPAPRHL